VFPILAENATRAQGEQFPIGHNRPMDANAILVQVAAVGALNVYALALVLLRAPLYKVRLYRPMVLNIGLSVAPPMMLAVTLGALLAVVVAAPSPAAVWITLVLGGGLWLLLLPNAAYLITELNLSHRAPKDPVPLWYDIVLVLSLALSGVMNTLLSVAMAQTLYSLVAHPNAASPLHGGDSWLITAGVLVLVSVGMYLGRYIRFNSWDVLHPVAFWRKLGAHFAQPGAPSAALGFCVTHTVLLGLLYAITVVPAMTLITATA